MAAHPDATDPDTTDPDTTDPEKSAEPEPIIVVIAHGSRSDEANELHRALCAAAAARLGLDARPAFLELAQPSIGDAIDAAVADGAHRVVAHPMFLLPGNHIRRDIPAAIDAARRRHPDVTIELTPHLGAAGLDRLVAEIVAAYLDPAAGAGAD